MRQQSSHCISLLGLPYTSVSEEQKKNVVQILLLPYVLMEEAIVHVCLCIFMCHPGSVSPKAHGKFCIFFSAGENLYNKKSTIPIKYQNK